ncbi:MAG: Ig-like domain-containing protein, partial [Pseudomonadales bacterium]
GSRAPMNAFEPGSGSTIMAYASICGEEDIQAAADAYFHTNSIEQIRTYLASDEGSSCGTASSTSNSIPAVAAGADGAIPMQTPFVLTGSASDADVGDNLSYAWEQMDLGPATNSRASFVDDGQRPLFRSFTPADNASRTFPQISDVVNAATTYGEILPTTARTLNFRLTVRDGNGGVISDDRQLSVSDSAGPFTVNTPNGSRWTAGTQTVSWDVANTTAAPINCANVQITLSTDGGMTNSITLLASTANSGSASVEIPAINTSMGRVRVQCTTQPFFAVNPANITIGEGGGSTNTPPVANDDSFTLAQSSTPNNLNVLSNDSDADNNTLRIVGLNNVVSGTAAIAADELSIDYTQADGFTGTTSFDYRISDGDAEVTATVSITVNEEVTPTPPAPTPAPTSSGGGGGSVDISIFILMLAIYMILSVNRQRFPGLLTNGSFKPGVSS